MKRLLLLALLLPLAACNQHSEHTKAWHLQNADARVKRVQECNNDAAQAATADCQNALAANAQANILCTGSDNKAPKLTN